MQVPSVQPTVTVSRTEPSSFVRSPIITLVVGKAKKEFFGHEALLVAYSPFFKACLKSGFAEGQTHRVELEDDDEEAFDAFLGWLYTGSLSNPQNITTVTCTKLYRLADKFLVTDLKNVIVDHLRLSWKEKRVYPWPDHIVRLHDHGLLHSRLGRLHLHLLTYRLMNEPSKFMTDAEDEYSERRLSYFEELYQNPDSMAAILDCIIQYQMKPWDDPRHTKTVCDFHEHNDGEICSALDDGNTGFQG